MEKKLKDNYNYSRASSRAENKADTEAKSVEGAWK